MARNIAMEQIRELWRVVRAMQRTGIVESVNTGSGTLVVKWPEGPSSLPMPWLVSSAGLSVEPSPGDQVTVFAEGGDPHLARALVGLSSTDQNSGNKTGAARADLVEAEFSKISAALDSVAAGVDGAGSSNFTGPNTYRDTALGEVDATKVKID